MREFSPFRGTCGEVVNGFLSPATLFTLGPVFIVMVLLVSLAGLLVFWTGMPSWMTFPILGVAASPVTGLFAMAARQGDLDAGFLDCLVKHRDRVPAFVLRHSMLTLAWALPVGFGFSRSTDLLGRAAGGFLFGGGPEGGTVLLASTVIAGLLLALLLMPTFTLLVATRTDALSECFETAAWRWVLVERRADAWVMVASMAGAMIVFFICMLPVAALFVAMFATTSPELAATVGILAYFSPLLASVILTGRMAGAFALADFLAPVGVPGLTGAAKAPLLTVAELRAGTRHDADLASGGAAPVMAAMAEPVPVPAMARTAPQSAPSVRPAPSGTALGLSLARLRERSDVDLPGVLAELEVLRAANPRSPAVHHELALALRSSGRTEEACIAAGQAIQLGLVTGAGPIARDTFTAFRSEADRLGLDAKSYDQVARLLLTHGDPAAAAWCHRAAASMGGESGLAQKGLISAADKAARAGDVEMAATIYQSLIDEFPPSPMTEHARELLRTLNRRT